MPLQFSSPIVACILDFTEPCDFAQLLNCSKQICYARGGKAAMYLRYVGSLEYRVPKYRAEADYNAARWDRCEKTITLYYPNHSRFIVARVACADCGGVLALKDASEIGETGRYLHAGCAAARVAEDDDDDDDDQQEEGEEEEASESDEASDSD
jgi:ribosomal protein S27E